MSEKDARYCLKLLRDEMPDSIDKVLAAEPDVVKVLRWANERRAYYLDEVSQTHDCLRDTNFYKGKAGMAAEIQGYCRQFVHLTETGWEWTDGGEDAADGR